MGRAMATRTQIIEAIVAKNMRGVCEVCGGQDWLVPNRAGLPDSTMLLTIPINGELQEAVAFVPMICNTCSNTRMLHLDTLVGKANG